MAPMHASNNHALDRRKKPVYHLNILDVHTEKLVVNDFAINHIPLCIWVVNLLLSWKQEFISF